MGRNQCGKSVAALDIEIAGTVTPKRGFGARKANVHAQDARSPSVVFRVGAEATPDRPQRQRQPEHGARPRGAFWCGGIALAAAG